jgi:DnaJ-class molecular chaperone
MKVQFFRVITEHQPCAECYSTGKINGHTCYTCQGKRLVNRKSTLEITDEIESLRKKQKLSYIDRKILFGNKEPEFENVIE